jgi:hypothetical protein
VTNVILLPDLNGRLLTWFRLGPERAGLKRRGQEAGKELAGGEVAAREDKPGLGSGVRSRDPYPLKSSEKCARESALRRPLTAACVSIR